VNQISDIRVAFISFVRPEPTSAAQVVLRRHLANHPLVSEIQSKRDQSSNKGSFN
jgi:hypothetical protein